MSGHATRIAETGKKTALKHMMAHHDFVTIWHQSPITRATDWPTTGKGDSMSGPDTNSPQRYQQFPQPQTPAQAVRRQSARPAQAPAVGPIPAGGSRPMPGGAPPYRTPMGPPSMNSPFPSSAPSVARRSNSHVMIGIIASAVFLLLLICVGVGTLMSEVGRTAMSVA